MAKILRAADKICSYALLFAMSCRKQIKIDRTLSPEIETRTFSSTAWCTLLELDAVKFDYAIVNLVLDKAQLERRKGESKEVTTLNVPCLSAMLRCPAPRSPSMKG